MEGNNGSAQWRWRKNKPVVRGSPMILYERVPLLPLGAFDNDRCRRRGPLDDNHAVLRRIIGREFAGAGERPPPNAIYDWLVNDVRSPCERAWCAEVLVAASADPWFSLRALVGEDAVSIYDFARVCAEDACRHAPLTTWLNKYADQPADETARLKPPAWATAGLTLTRHGYWVRNDESADGESCHRQGLRDA